MPFSRYVSNILNYKPERRAIGKFCFEGEQQIIGAEDLLTFLLSIQTDPSLLGNTNTIYIEHMWGFHVIRGAKYVILFFSNRSYFCISSLLLLQEARCKFQAMQGLFSPSWGCVCSSWMLEGRPGRVRRRMHGSLPSTIPAGFPTVGCLLTQVIHFQSRPNCMATWSSAPEILCLFPFLSPSLFCPVVVSFSGTWEAFCQTNHFTIMMDVWRHCKALLLDYLQLTFLAPHALGATDSWVFGQSGSQSEGQQCLCSQALKPVWGLLCTYLLPRFSLGFASGIVGTHSSMELATSTLTFLFLP